MWSLARSGDRVHAGTKPAALLESDDDGATFSQVKGLTDHPSASEWGPGAAGLTLHTIIPDPADPERMWVGISAAGVFSTHDGGVTWERRNDLADPADGEGHEHPAAASDGHTGLCVHHVEVAARGNDGADAVLYQQNHFGVTAPTTAGSSGSTSRLACHRSSASRCTPSARRIDAGRRAAQRGQRGGTRRMSTAAPRSAVK